MKATGVNMTKIFILPVVGGRILLVQDVVLGDYTIEEVVVQ